MKRHGHIERDKKVQSYSKRDSEVMGYIASYLIPFASLQLDKNRNILAMVIFLLVLAVIYVNSNMVYINPVLSFCGYRIYEIEVENSQRSKYYIARHALERQNTISYVELSDDIYLEK